MLTNVLSLVDAPKCQPSRSVFRLYRSLGPSLTSVLHRSQSIGTTCLYLTFTMSSKLHTCIPTQLRDMLHTHAMVSLQTQPKSIISDNHTSQTRHTWQHINLVLAQRTCLKPPRLVSQNLKHISMNIHHLKADTYTYCLCCA